MLIKCWSFLAAAYTLWKSYADICKHKVKTSEDGAEALKCVGVIIKYLNIFLLLIPKMYKHPTSIQDTPT